MGGRRQIEHRSDPAIGLKAPGRPGRAMSRKSLCSAVGEQDVWKRRVVRRVNARRVVARDRRALITGATKEGSLYIYAASSGGRLSGQTRSDGVEV